MHDLVMTVIENILIILVTLAAGFIIAYLKKRIGVEGMLRIERELALKQELAILAVRFIEQVYRDIGGPEKYSRAALWLSSRLEEKGITISPEEIRGLIEAALRELKDEFGNEWAKTIETL